MCFLSVYCFIVCYDIVLLLAFYLQINAVLFNFQFMKASFIKQPNSFQHWNLS